MERMLTVLPRIFVIGCAVALFGCKSAAPDSSRSEKALRARLEAAEAMTGGNRFDALASVARSAADANNVEIAKRSLEQLGGLASLLGVNPTGECALTFLRHGNLEAANTIAKLLPAGEQREEVLRKIATHK